MEVAPGEYNLGKRYLDFVVDGRSLAERLDDPGRHTIFGWILPEHYPRLIGELLLAVPTPLPEGRVPIYVCPACAVMACGALTAVVRRVGNDVVWEDFVTFSAIHGEPGAYDLPSNPYARRPHAGVGPFKFEAEAYSKTLCEALATLVARKKAPVEHLLLLTHAPNPIILPEPGMPAIEVTTTVGSVDLHGTADFLGYEREGEVLHLNWRLDDANSGLDGRCVANLTLILQGLTRFEVSPVDLEVPRSEDKVLEFYEVLMRRSLGPWRAA